jgi:hypothetical protein
VCVTWAACAQCLSLATPGAHALQALSHWPNVVSVGRKEAVSSWGGMLDSGGGAGGGGAAGGAVASVLSAVGALRNRGQGAQVKVE